MKSFTAITLSVATLVSMAQGYVISNCRTPQTYNLGDNKCHDWTDPKYSFQSNAGCTLTFYDTAGCQGKASAGNTVQNTCLDVGFNPQSMRCST
ncbi:hypothetical protein F4779DRAFT_563605 [Xylariaceae sp. FL0662B]|nr:hypothetical protein F4779DRAFT_563605 [Xylariaceae sp. FL0662B]